MATTNFIDKIENPINGIKIISDIIQKDGIWVNFGTLDFQSKLTDDSKNIELTKDDLFNVIKELGFRIEYVRYKLENNEEDNHSMIKIMRKNVFFVAVKKY